MEVARIAEENAGTRGAASVLAVELEVGSDAGVEISNLEFCLDVVLSQPPFQRAKAVIQRSAGDVLRVLSLEVDDEHPHD